MKTPYVFAIRKILTITNEEIAFSDGLYDHEGNLFTSGHLNTK